MKCHQQPPHAVIHNLMTMPVIVRQSDVTPTHSLIQFTLRSLKANLHGNYTYTNLCYGFLVRTIDKTNQKLTTKSQETICIYIPVIVVACINVNAIVLIMNGSFCYACNKFSLIMSFSIQR